MANKETLKAIEALKAECKRAVENAKDEESRQAWIAYYGQVTAKFLIENAQVNK